MVNIKIFITLFTFKRIINSHKKKLCIVNILWEDHSDILEKKKESKQ